MFVLNIDLKRKNNIMNIENYVKYQFCIIIYLICSKHRY